MPPTHCPAALLDFSALHLRRGCLAQWASSVLVRGQHRQLQDSSLKAATGKLRACTVEKESACMHSKAGTCMLAESTGCADGCACMEFRLQATMQETHIRLLRCSYRAQCAGAPHDCRPEVPQLLPGADVSACPVCITLQVTQVRQWPVQCWGLAWPPTCTPRIGQAWGCCSCCCCWRRCWLCWSMCERLGAAGARLAARRRMCYNSLRLWGSR